MTVPTQTNKAIFTANGVTTEFPFTFGTLPTADLVVTLIDGDTERVVNPSDYTVRGAGRDDGGSVVFNVPPDSGITVLIQRLVPYTQPTDYKNQGSFYPRTHERSFDRAAMQVQQLAEEVGRSVRIRPGYTLPVSLDLPTPEASRLLGWNVAGTALRNTDVSGPADLLLRSDLADPTGGGALVAFRQSGPGAVRRTLEDKARDVVSIKDYGGIPNDNSASAQATNFLALCRAVRVADRVEVADTYYMTWPSPEEISKSIILDGRNSGRIVYCGVSGAAFKLAGTIGHVKVVNLTFEPLNSGSAAALFLHSVDETAGQPCYVDEVEFTGNSFLGNIIGLNVEHVPTSDPSEVTFGLGTLTLDNNTIVNSRRKFVYLRNTPHRNIYVLNNRIKNFDFTVVSHVIHNTPHVTKHQQLGSMDVKGNVVYCDDSWFGTVGAVTQDYYCFVLYEGFRFNYQGNHVEGIKTDNNASVYDHYANAIHVESHGNVWKNNLSFHPAKTNNELMKCKGAIEASYRNNRYVVSEAFITRLGKSLSNAWVDWHIQTEEGDLFEVIGCDFDCYWIRFPFSTALKSTRVINNEVNARKVEGNLIGVNLSASDSYSDSEVIIRGNRVSADGVGGQPFRVVRIQNADGVKKYGRIEVVGNYFRNCENFFRDVAGNAHDLLVDGNTVDYDLDDATTFFWNLDATYGHGAVVAGSDSNVFSRNTLRSGRPVGRLGIAPRPFVAFDNVETAQFSALNSIQLEPYNPESSTVHVNADLEYEGQGYYSRFGIRFEYGYDAGQDRNYLSFRDEAGLPVTVYLNRDDGSDSHVVGHDTQIEVHQLASMGDPLPVVRVKNTTTNTYISISVAAYSTSDVVTRRSRIGGR